MRRATHGALGAGDAKRLLRHVLKGREELLRFGREGLREVDRRDRRRTRRERELYMTTFARSGPMESEWRWGPRRRFRALQRSL